MTKRSGRETSYQEPQGAAESREPKYVLRLYVAGQSRKSLQAIRNLKNLIKEHLHESYDLEVIDIYQQPIFAKDGQSGCCFFGLVFWVFETLEFLFEYEQDFILD